MQFVKPIRFEQHTQQLQIPAINTEEHVHKYELTADYRSTLQQIWTLQFR